MHDEKRPLTDFYYPHNPKRLVYWTEDSRAYWQPNPDSYKQLPDQAPALRSRRAAGDRLAADS